MMLLGKVLAEMLGTFAVIFIGGGSIILSERYPQQFPLFCVPLAWGVVIALMILAVGNISGAHFNPVVTLAFAVAKRFPAALVVVYWLSQFAGGVTAIRLLTVLQRIK